MREERKLAARMIAADLTEINAELDRALAAEEPDWELVERLSAEAASVFVTEDEIAQRQKLLLAAGLPAKRRSLPIRRFSFAAAAAIAAVALFTVPAAMRGNRSIRKEPVQTAVSETQTTDISASSEETVSSVTTEPTASRSAQTETTAAPESVSAAVTTETSGTGTTAAPSSASAGRQTTRTTVTTTASSSEMTKVTTASSQEPVTETSPSVNTVPPDETHTPVTEQTKTPASGNVRVVYLYTVDDEATEWQSEEAQVIGAELELYDMEGDLVCRWVSDGKGAAVELDQSQTYRLHAASVPEGYRKPLRDRIFTPDDSDVKRPRNLVYLRKAN